MKKLIAAAALALATLTVSPAPADAHNYDNYSIWYCAWSRPSSSYYVVHSVPDYVTPTHMREFCGAVIGQVAVQWRVWVDLEGGGWMYADSPAITDCRYHPCDEP